MAIGEKRSKQMRKHIYQRVMTKWSGNLDKSDIIDRKFLPPAHVKYLRLNYTDYLMLRSVSFFL